MPTTPLPLWPDQVPDDGPALPPPTATLRENGALFEGQPVTLRENISAPSLTVHHPTRTRATGTAVVVCPGGGYNLLAWDLEGTEVCTWLNHIGITAILLNYRVPRREHVPFIRPPLQDLQRALSLTRHHATAWGIDAMRVGALGFSAGAHLAAHAGSRTIQRAYRPLDEADTHRCRPDFCMLIYPAYLTDPEDLTHLAPELSVDARTPPSFITMAQDDPVRVENALTYHRALLGAGVPCELHVYPFGGHGYGLRRTTNPATHWPDRAEAWLGESDWLRPGISH